MKKPKIPKQISLKTALIFIGISILLISGVFYVLGATPSTPSGMSPGLYPGAPSYTIWKEGSNYFAKDAGGLLKYSGTNASQITKNCIDALPAEGGLIHFTSGYFYFTHTIVIARNNVHIDGEGSDNTRLLLSNAANCHLFSITPATLKNFISIRNLSLKGNKANQVGQSHGIYIYGYAGDIFLTDLYIDDFNSSGIFVLPISRVWNLWIKNCLIEGNTEEGIYLKAHVAIHFVHITGNYLHGNKNGIRIQNNTGRAINIEENIIKENQEHGILLEGAQYVNIIGNQIFDNSVKTTATYDGVYVGIYTTNNAYNINIEDNIITNQGFNNKQRYGINVADLSDNLTIQGNNLVNNALAGMNVSTGACASSEIHHNLGFNTENSGSAIISSSTVVTVNHGLVATPTSVTVTMGSSGTGDYYISDLTSTQFTVHVTSSGTYTVYWYAEYTP